MCMLLNLNQRARELALKHWGIEYDLPVYVNNELQYHGRLVPAEDKHENIYPVAIELSQELINNYTVEYIDGVLLHELCHGALFTQGKPCDEFDTEFLDDAEKVGALLPNQIPLIGWYHSIICSKCKGFLGRVNGEVSNSSLRGYYSDCCNASVNYAGRIFINQLDANK